MKTVYSVFVDGTEVNDSYLDKESAEMLGYDYLHDNYDEVIIVKFEKTESGMYKLVDDYILEFIK